MKTKPALALLVVLGALIVPLAGLAALQDADPGFKTDASGNKSYFMAVEFSKDQYTVNEVSVLNSEAPEHKIQPETGFRCEVVSASDEILYSFRFTVPTVVCSDTFSADDSISGGCQTKDSGGFSLSMPYFKTAKSIGLYDQNDKMVASADVSSFAWLCGDGVCQENENSGTCPSDCRSGIKDSYCDPANDGVCDPDCAANLDPDCAKSGGNLFYAIAAALILLIVVLGGYFIWRRTGKNGQSNVENEQN